MPLVKRKDIDKYISDHIPEFVFDVYNRLIVKNWYGSFAKITLKELIANLKVAAQQNNMEFTDNWVHIESLLEEAGWKVTYDRPGYCERYDAFYLFE